MTTVVRAAGAPAVIRRSPPLTRAWLIVVALWAFTVLAHLALPRAGLRAEYFRHPDWSGPVAIATVDPDATTTQLSRAWRYDPPATYSVQWFGWLTVDRADDYAFRLTAAGRAQVEIDGRVVLAVQQPGTNAIGLRLGAGPHAIGIRYSTTGEGSEFAWAWALGSKPFEAVPSWRLSPRRERYPVLIARRFLDWIWPFLTAAVVVLGAAVAWQRRSSSRIAEYGNELAAVPRVPLRPSLLCLGLFLSLAVLHTWPLATAPAYLSREDNADTLLNEWTLAWVVHQAPRHPFALFDANIFYPEHDSLAFSEPLIPQSVLAAPILASGGSPRLAYNLVLIAGFALTAWTMSLVMKCWTGSWLAGIASGAILAFNAHTLTRLPHIQAQHAEFLPLALFAFDSLLRKPRWSAAMWVVAWTVVQALCSIYLLVFTVFALAAVLLARPSDWLGERFRLAVPKLAGAVALGAGLLVPLLLPYWRLHAVGFTRSLDEAALYAAVPTDYLAGQSHLFARAARGSALFPGAVALALTLYFVLTGKAFRSARARGCIVFGTCGMLLSFGPAAVPGYDLLYSFVPLLSAIRVSARFGYLTIVAVAFLAGFGVDCVRRRGAFGGAANVATSLIVIAVMFEPLSAPISYTPGLAVPSVYSVPATDPDAVVAELPFPPPDAPFRNARFMLDSTKNWRPLLNGYSGFVPPSYVTHYLALREFPSAESIRALQAFGVTRVFVHLDELAAGGEAALGREKRLHRIAVDGPVALYSVDRARLP